MPMILLYTFLKASSGSKTHLFNSKGLVVRRGDVIWTQMSNKTLKSKKEEFT